MSAPTIIDRPTLVVGLVATFLLVTAGTDLSAHEVGSDQAAFMKAAEAGDVSKLNRLLSAGAAVNVANKSGVTALMFAAASGHAEATAVLLKAGAYVNARERRGTPLHFGASS